MNLDSFIKDKTLLFTVTSDGYKYFSWNLWLHLKKVSPVPLCILCLDKESYSFFNRMAMIPSKLYIPETNSFEHKSPAVFGSASFKRLNQMKLKALQELSQRTDIEKLIYLDSDIAVFDNFFPALDLCFQQHPLWFQCDEARDDDFTCSDPNSCPNGCSGVIAMLLTDEMKENYNKMYSIDDKWKTAVGDQDYINEKMKANGISFKTLSREQFPNGRLLSKDKFKERNPLLLHFNYTTGTQKKGFMQKKNCWLLPL